MNGILALHPLEIIFLLLSEGVGEWDEICSRKIFVILHPHYSYHTVLCVLVGGQVALNISIIDLQKCQTVT